MSALFHPVSDAVPEGGKPSRRGFFVGAAAVGATATAVNLLPSVAPMQPVEAAKPPPERGGGYSASAHVQRYYKTARV